MPKSSVTRREFTLALAGGAALATDQSMTLGQDAAPSDDGSKTPSEKKSPSDAGQATKKPADQVEAREPPPEAAYLLGLVMRRYPDDRLDETAVNGIVRDIYGDLTRSRILSSFPLDNSDEPGFTFRAWRAS